jgi:hypothetical protein
LAPFILPRLTYANSIATLLHPAVAKYTELAEGVCQFVGDNFLKMLPTMEDDLMRIPREHLAMILQACCHHVDTDQATVKVVRFCLNHSNMDSACDLLRESKTWDWNHGEETHFISKEEPTKLAPTWIVKRVRDAMKDTPEMVVKGQFFDWTAKLDYGAEGKLRIVYEDTVTQHETPKCINRFPAAMFHWRVVFRGKDVFKEKPVFICFPENVSLHWSTTLPVSASELSEEDDIEISVTMAENPMLSLVLYYFSADLKSTLKDQDILNRLPHIEYRCLSSYTLMKTHG